MRIHLQSCYATAPRIPTKNRLEKPWFRMMEVQKMYKHKRMSATKRAYLAGLRKGKRIGARKKSSKRKSYRRYRKW